ncbi:MAG: leucine-rich repeat domain-containing protein [Flavobacteriales bacterium]|nr:leucine-rich repeat domain-containing protein [Flavobacteriales bacterium]
MSKKIFILLFLPLFSFGQFTFVPDDNFEQALINLGIDFVLDDYVETIGLDTITYLYIPSNSITDLTGIEDFSSLRELFCNSNQISSLDFSNNTQLFELNCSANQLTSLDVRNGNNQGLLYFSAMNNQALNCIDVDDVAWANNNWSKDTWTLFSANCSVSGIEVKISNKRLLKVIDVFGRSVTPKPNIPLLYIFDDGTIEKKLIID